MLLQKHFVILHLLVEFALGSLDFKGLIIVSHRLHRFSQIFDSFGVFPLMFGDNCCSQQDYLCISVRSVGELKYHLQLCTQKELRTAVRMVMTKLMTFWIVSFFIVVSD